MAPRTKKERIFRHMAREVPEYKLVLLDRDELLDDVTFGGNVTDSTFLLKKYLGNWLRFVQIRWGSDVEINVFSDYDIDFNRYRLGGKVVLE